jgi:hypothetical protein
MEYQYYSFVKIKRQISRRLLKWNNNKPFFNLYIDWTDFKEVYAGFIQVMLIYNTYLGRSFLYFITMHSEEKEIL